MKKKSIKNELEDIMKEEAKKTLENNVFRNIIFVVACLLITPIILVGPHIMTTTNLFESYVVFSITTFSIILWIIITSKINGFWLLIPTTTLLGAITKIDIIYQTGIILFAFIIFFKIFKIIINAVWR